MTCVSVGFAVSSNICVDFADEDNAMGRMTSLGDASSCACSDLSGMHGSIARTCDDAAGKTESS